jgi:hypothetical protein
MKPLAPLLTTLVLAGCAAIQPAQMALPPDLPARTEATTIAGMGGGTRGSFTVGAVDGNYARSATRLSFFDDLAVFDRGGAGFNATGLVADATVEASCKMRQTTVTIGIVGFAPKPLAYECDLRARGAPLAARFTLQESRDTLGQVTAQVQRRGLIEWDGVALTIRSVHTVQGSPLPLQAPIGYVFEQDGRAVGAVELNGLTPRLWLPPAGDVKTRQASLVAALALAVFWDPAQLY